MGRRIYLIAVLAFLFVFQRSAYSQRYPFRNYSVEEGLPSPRVWSIIQDRKGYLWFGTSSGACKFDGNIFSHYSTVDGLAGNVVFRIFEDSKGNLWFYSWGLGVSRFDGEILTTYTTEDGLSENTVFPSPRGPRYHSIHKTFDRAVRKLGIRIAGDRKLQFHDLRRLCATWLLNRGRSLDEVREVLGHADRRTTDRYARLKVSGDVMDVLPSVSREIKSPGR